MRALHRHEHEKKEMQARRSAKHYVKNKQKMIARAAKWRDMNRGADRYLKAKYRYKAITPAWADEDKIAEVYMNVPEGMVVDHIIPRNGDTVSGLHTHNNLQYLTNAENRLKGNNFNEEEK